MTRVARTFGPVAVDMPRAVSGPGAAWTGRVAGRSPCSASGTYGGVSLFLFGTTFLWLTPMFAAAEVDTSGVAWAAVGVLASVTIIGFTVATWGLFRRTDWWESLGVACAVAGLVTLVPYWIAADGSGVANPVFDVVIHAAGSFGVLLLLRLPRLRALGAWACRDGPLT